MEGFASIVSKRLDGNNTSKLGNQFVANARRIYLLQSAALEFAGLVDELY